MSGKLYRFGLLGLRLSTAPPPAATSSATRETARGANASNSAAADAPKSKTQRTVTARYAHHLWHIDLSLPRTSGGFCVPWVPFSLPQCWPFCFHLAVILDHFSRSIVAWTLLYKEPTAQAICRLLDQARDAVGRAPKYIVSDQGAQFQHDYRTWCGARRGRRGARGPAARARGSSSHLSWRPPRHLAALRRITGIAHRTKAALRAPAR
jgi:transposase InsO family protein